MTAESTLAEDLFVLSYRRDTRAQKARPRLDGNLGFTIRAAAIIELVLAKTVRVVPRTAAITRDTYSLRPVGGPPSGNSPLEALLEVVSDHSNRDRQLSSWLSSSRTAGDVVTDLVSRGLVSEESTTFGPFRRDYRLMPVDVEFDNAIRDRFEAVFLGDDEASERDRILAALMVDGRVTGYYAPLDDKLARARFDERVRCLADTRRPSAGDTTPIAVGDGVALVLQALGFTQSSGG